MCSDKWRKAARERKGRTGPKPPCSPGGFERRRPQRAHQDVDESCQRATEIEKGDAPCEVEKKLDAEQSDQSFFPGRVAAEDQSGRNADAQINDRPCDREHDVRRCQGRLVEQRVPVLDGVRLDSAGDEPQQEVRESGSTAFFSFSGSFLPLMCNNRAQRLGFSGRTGMRSHMSRA